MQCLYRFRRWFHTFEGPMVWILGFASGALKESTVSVSETGLEFEVLGTPV